MCGEQGAAVGGELKIKICREALVGYNVGMCVSSHPLNNNYLRQVEAARIA